MKTQKKSKIRTIFQADSRIPLQHFTSARKIVLMKCTTSPPSPLPLLPEESGQTDKSATRLPSRLCISPRPAMVAFFARPSKPRAKWRRAGRFAINKKRAEQKKNGRDGKDHFWISGGKDSLQEFNQSKRKRTMKISANQNSRASRVSDALPSLQVFASTTTTLALSVSVSL